MRMNTENGIRIFGITTRIYSNTLFWEIVPLSLQEIVCLFWHWTYQDTSTVHDQLEVQKVQSGVPINHLELGFLYMVNCFLTTCNSAIFLRNVNWISDFDLCR